MARRNPGCLAYGTQTCYPLEVSDGRGRLRCVAVPWTNVANRSDLGPGNFNHDAAATHHDVLGSCTHCKGHNETCKGHVLMPHASPSGESVVHVRAT